MRIVSARYLLPINAPPIEDGALLIDGEQILAVASREELAAAHPRAAAVDFGDTVILPPLVNAHTHLELTDFPSWAELAGQSSTTGGFVDWIMHLVQVRRTVGNAAIRASLFAGLWKSLAAGTGAIGDILTTLPAVDAYALTPLRGRVFAEVLGVEPARVASRQVDIAAGLTTHPGRWLSWGLSPHAPYTLSPETLDDTLGFARTNALAIAMHWAETVEESDFLAGGCGPLAERLYPMVGWPAPAAFPVPSGVNRLPSGSLLIHGVHATPETIDSLAATGLGVVLCPRSNRRFSDTRAPLTNYRRAGVPLALGTDSLASSPSLSVWDELAFARHWFAGVLAPADWLAMATAGGARALGLAGRMGQLAAGYEASFQVVTLPDGATLATLEEALCSGEGEIRVQALCLGGQRIYDTTTQPINQFQLA